VGRFSRKSDDGTPEPNARSQTLVIQNGEVDEQTRVQLRDLGLDPDRFVAQMQAIEMAATVKAERA
jgi:hypothetical protein